MRSWRASLVGGMLLGLALPSQAMAQEAATSQEDGEPMPDFDVAPSSTARIIGGVLTSEQPAIGALLRVPVSGKRPANCSGTLVGCRWFLTAAHCVIDGRPATSYRVFLDHAGFLSVKDVHSPQGFKGCARTYCPPGDIALVELEQAPRGIRSLPITEGTPLPAGEPGTIFGFGLSRGERNDYGLKRRGPVRIKGCEAQQGDSSWLCFRFRPPVTANTCNGDSGGPLLAGGEVAGVTSWGRDVGGCGPGDLAYDTRVTKYAGWLKQVAGQELRAEACGVAPHAGEAGAPVSYLVPTTPYRPDGSPNKPHKLAVKAGTSELRLALHGTGPDSLNVTDIRLEARRPGSTSADPRCETTLSKMQNFASCSVSKPEVGDWRLVVAFDTKDPGAEADFTYQLIATAFRAQP